MVRHGPHKTTATALEAFKTWTLRRMLWYLKLTVLYSIEETAIIFREYRETQFRCNDIR